eukprot:5269558-Pleurochrysis_carterae.AAC.1
MRICARIGMYRSCSSFRALAATRRFTMLEHIIVLTCMSTTRAGTSLPLSGQDLRVNSSPTSALCAYTLCGQLPCPPRRGRTRARRGSSSTSLQHPGFGARPCAVPRA